MQGLLPGQQTVLSASYGANRLGFDLGEFVHVSLGKGDEEYIPVLAADQDSQTFIAVFTKDHSTGAAVRPTIWPTPILNEGDSLAFDILAVASPNPGGDLTVGLPTSAAMLLPAFGVGLSAIPPEIRQFPSLPRGAH
jgi:hypothetical protein